MLAQPHPVVLPQANLIAPLQVILPPEMANFFAESGYCQTTFSECRNNARLRVRVESTLTFEYSPTFAKRQFKHTRVLVKDLSKTGIAVLVHHQMWPTEKFSLELHGRLIEADVVRCRKLGDCCFEVGATVRSVSVIEETA
jgi:hypothetical protein